MADIASLGLEVRFDQVKQATAALRDMPAAASAAERAAEKWSAGTTAAARSADDFSKRVQRTIADLEFQRQQLARTSAEQEKYAALRRAGVAALSAEGQAISASVAALQAQKSAQMAATESAKQAQQQSAGFAALAQKQADATKAVVESLEFERQQLARTSAERAKYSALRQAGVSATSTEGQAVTGAVNALQAEKAALIQAAAATATKEQAALKLVETNRRTSESVANVLAGLQFEKDQLGRNSTEQARYQALKTAGVSAASAEGKAITASVQALQAQKAALADNVGVVEKVRSSWSQLRSILVTFGVLAIAQKLIEAAKSAFEAAAGLDELSQQLGITARGLQALQLQAVQNGVNLEQLETGVSKFSQKMGEAAGGSKEMIEALDKLGVKIIDANGNLIPTEQNLQNVAKAITLIEDPAIRSANAVTFFGKAGTRMLPLLGEMAKGIDGLAASAERSGAIISDETIAALDKVADRMEKSKLEWRAFFANNAADAIGFFDKLGVMWDQSAQSVNKWVKETGASFKAWVDGLNETLIVGSAQATASFLEAFAQVPDQLGKLFTDAWNSALTATANGINTITAWIASNAPSWMGLTGGTNVQPLLSPGGGANVGGMSAGVLAAGQKAAADAQAQIAVAREAADRQALINRQAAMGGDDARARIGKLGASLPGGASNPPPKGAGDAAAKEAENQAKAYAKLVEQLDATAKSQDLMTAASARGDVQFEAAKIHLDAQQKAIGIYGKALDDTDPKLQKIEELLRRIAEGKAAEAFNVATTELQKQNVILEAQIGLMNQAPEIQAREIALIKAKQEAEKAGTAVTQEMIDARKAAIEQNETLKLQQEQLKKAQDLWTAPLKRALEDIQSTAADAFEQILTSGNFSFQSLGEAFKKIVIQMAAQFLALATIRPVMSVVVNAIGGSGIAGQLGLGSGNTAGGGGIGGLGGLSSLGNMFGGGGFLSMFQAGGAAGSVLGTGGLFGGAVPSAAGVMGPMMPGALGAGGVGIGGGLSAGFAAVPVAGWIAAAAAIAKSILGPGGKSGSVTGALSTLLGPSPEEWMKNPKRSLLNALNPVLMAGLNLFGITPFDDTPPVIQDQAYGQLAFSGGKFGTSGGAWGPNATASDLQNPLQAGGDTLDSIFKALGGVKNPGKVFGFSMESNSLQSPDWQFQNQTSYLVNPDGTRRQWGQGSNQGDVGMDSGLGEVAIQSLLGGAVGDISKNLRSVLEKISSQGAASLSSVAQSVNDIKAFDDALAEMGKTTTEAGDAIKQIDDSFKTMYDTVAKYGLDKGQVDAQVQAQKFAIGKDFAESISYQLSDPKTQALFDIDKQRTTDLANNAALVAAQIQGYEDQATNIEALYQKKRLAIMDAANADALAAQEQLAAAQKAILNGIAASVSRVQDLIDRLTPGGDLANVDPRTQLAGLRASYNASYAQAISDPTNDALIQKAIQDAAAFTETSLKFNAGNSAYEQDRQTILSQLQALQQATASGGMSQATDPDVKNLLSKILQAVNAPATNDNAAQRDADIATVMALLARFLANGRTAA